MGASDESTSLMQDIVRNNGDLIFMFDEPREVKWMSCERSLPKSEVDIKVFDTYAEGIQFMRTMKKSKFHVPCISSVIQDLSSPSKAPALPYLLLKLIEVCKLEIVSSGIFVDSQACLDYAASALTRSLIEETDTSYLLKERTLLRWDIWRSGYGVLFDCSCDVLVYNKI
jgi:hypothetical protein